jgi:hypothetical protein
LPRIGSRDAAPAVPRIETRVTTCHNDLLSDYVIHRKATPIFDVDLYYLSSNAKFCPVSPSDTMAEWSKAVDLSPA